MSRNKLLFLLFATLLLDMIGVGMLIPIIPSLFTDPTSPSFLLFGYSETSRYVIAGLTVALFGFMQFLAAPILGELSDIYGRKKLLALGVGTLAIANLVFAFGIEIASLSVLLISRAIAGIAGANFSIAQAAIADVTRPEDRAKSFGLIGAAFGLGFILGPLLGGWITGATGNPAIPFLFAGMLGILNLLMVSFLFPETRRVNTKTSPLSVLKAFHNIQSAWRDVDVRPVYIVSFLSMLGFAFFTSFITVFLVERFNFSETDTGIYFAVVGLWIIFAQVVVVRFVSARYSERTILLWTLPVLALVIALQGFAPNVMFLYALMPIMASAFGLMSTAIPALVSKGVTADAQGAALGINGSLQALTQGIAPLAAGVVSGVLGLPAAFLFGAAFALGGMEVMRRQGASRTRTPDDVPPKAPTRRMSGI
jgi:DHA1 family tetracycline resistance protein-like MFS transporter